jgi:hypothetical protein
MISALHTPLPSSAELSPRRDEPLEVQGRISSLVGRLERRSILAHEVDDPSIADESPTGTKRSRDASCEERPTVKSLEPPLWMERGILKKRNPLKATVISQGIPHWVLGMKSADWELFNSVRYDTEHRPEVQSALDRLSSKRRLLKSQNSPLAQSHLTDIGLVSGDSHFLRTVVPLLPAELPLVVCCERRSRRDPLPDRLGLRWTWISHSRVGGVTDQHISVGMRNLEGWSLAPRVSHRIGHIISHSERSKPCPQESTTPHCTTRDSLKRSKLHLPVVHPAHFSHTGFGQRSLTGAELCSAFNVPNWMKPEPSVLQTWLDADVFGSMVPLQLFSAALDETVPLIAPAVELIKTTPRLAEDAPECGVQLADINKFLDHSWIDPGLISEKLVESDDAGVATAMWDKRISLVLSVAIDAMNKIRTMLLRRLRQRNTRSLLSWQTHMAVIG